MSRLPVGVREFAVPLQREGSLTSGSGQTLLPLDFGQDIHERIQDRLRNEDQLFQAEYPLQQTFKEGSVTLHVRGRCDGFFNHETPLLEEIKSTQRFDALDKTLRESTEHPYILQIKVYGYMHWLKSGKTPELQLRLVCLQTLKEKVIPIAFDPESFQDWVKQRCEQIVAEFKRFRVIQKTRHNLSKKIFFPFAEPRPSQTQLMDSVKTALENEEHLLLQAPTGLGKTAGVLVPALTFALARGALWSISRPKTANSRPPSTLSAFFTGREWA
jgi:DNA excision repair protein ERCC-2